jgi:hypothetical protein
MNKTADFETVRQIKEKLCYIRSVTLKSQHKILSYLQLQYWILIFVTNCSQQRLQTGIPTRTGNDNSREELHCKPTISFHKVWICLLQKVPKLQCLHTAPNIFNFCKQPSSADVKHKATSYSDVIGGCSKYE